VPIGYGDGVRRTASSHFEVLVRGRRCPLAGVVSMDSLMIDLGAHRDARVGDPVVLIGRQHGGRILAEEVAARQGTINYDVVVGLGRRVTREYVEPDDSYGSTRAPARLWRRPNGSLARSVAALDSWSISSHTRP
jgi:alanine racemase